MDKKRLMLAGGLGLVGIVVFMQMRNLNAPAPAVPVAAPVVEQVQYVDILIAAQDVAFGSRITEESLQWKPWPADATSEAFINSDTRPQAMSELEGAVVRANIFSGEPINESKLVRAGEAGLMAALLKPGMRAVTTRISVETAAGGFIQPGDRVDIIMTRPLPRSRQANGGQQQQQYAANTIFENVHVLAIDQTFSTSEGAAITGSTATFEMTQADAEYLQQAAALGDLSLTLRGVAGGRDATGSAAVDRPMGEGETRTLVVYRNGEPQQVAIQGGMQ